MVLSADVFQLLGATAGEGLMEGVEGGSYYFSTQGTSRGGRLVFAFCFGLPSNIAIFSLSPLTMLWRVASPHVNADSFNVQIQTLEY